jgi:hypothetical protein
MRKLLSKFIDTDDLSVTLFDVIEENAYMMNIDDNNGEAIIKRIEFSLFKEIFEAFNSTLEEIAIEWYQDGKTYFHKDTFERTKIVQNKTCVIGFNKGFYISYFEDFEIRNEDKTEYINELITNFITESKANINE